MIAFYSIGFVLEACLRLNAKNVLQYFHLYKTNLLNLSVFTIKAIKMCSSVGANANTVPAYSFPSLILLCLACMPFLPGHPDFFSKPGLYCAHSLLSPAFGEGEERHVPVPSCSEAFSPQTSS